MSLIFTRLAHCPFKKPRHFYDVFKSVGVKAPKYVVLQSDNIKELVSLQ